MSSGRTRLLLVLLPLLLVPGCGRGDGQHHIANGYYSVWTSSDHFFISKNGRAGPIVIMPNAEKFEVIGDRILVARRPIDGIRYTGTCEYWSIDTTTDEVVGPGDSPEAVLDISESTASNVRC